MFEIVRCSSCDGYGWFEDDETFESVDCDWCDGTGYIYRDDKGIDRKIPPEDYGKVSAKLEQLETERLRDMGYSGTAKHPDEQAIRKGDEEA